MSAAACVLPLLCVGSLCMQHVHGGYKTCAYKAKSRALGVLPPCLFTDCVAGQCSWDVVRLLQVGHSRGASSRCRTHSSTLYDSLSDRRSIDRCVHIHTQQIPKKRVYGTFNSWWRKGFFWVTVTVTIVTVAGKRNRGYRCRKRQSERGDQ